MITCLIIDRGMTRWGEFDDLHHIDELAEVIQDGSKPDNLAEGDSKTNSVQIYFHMYLTFHLFMSQHFKFDDVFLTSKLALPVISVTFLIYILFLTQ